MCSSKVPAERIPGTDFVEKYNCRKVNEKQPKVYDHRWQNHRGLRIVSAVHKQPRLYQSQYTVEKHTKERKRVTLFKPQYASVEQLFVSNELIELLVTISRGTPQITVVRRLKKFDTGQVDFLCSHTTATKVHILFSFWIHLT